MTTLTGIQGNGFVVLAADSQITEDNLRTISSSTPKIVTRGKYVIGIVGDTRPGDILSYNWNPPVYKGEDPIQFMGKKVVPSIITAFNQNNYTWGSSDKDSGFDYLIAFNGNLFHIACDMSFIQADHGLYGLGTGGQFAMGYLWALRDSSYEYEWDIDSAKAFATDSIKCASILDTNTGLPVQLVTQERN